MRKIFIFLVIFIVSSSTAQEKLGITNSNYSSTNSIFLNPSSSVDSRTYMQLNLAGAYAFGMNNIGYLPKFSFWGPAREYHKTGSVTITPEVSTLKFNKYLYGYGSVDGPVFVMSKRNYGLGFFVRGRTVIDAKGTPFQLTNILLGQSPLSIPSADKIDLRNAKFSNMTWLEAGGNFGMMVVRHQNNMVTFGGNIKYIEGINIVYGDVIRLKGTQNDSLIDIESVDGKVRFTDNNRNAGHGIGLDVGVTYKKMLGPVETYNAHSTQSNCTYVDYKYKIGLSLRDLGYIKFKRNTSAADLKGSGYFYTDRDEAYYRSSLGPDLNAPYRHTPFLATLPTNLSVQFDYNFGYNFYFNATAVKNIVPARFTGSQGPSLVSFCPRYETKNFEVAMPLTFQRFLYPQLGVAFRVRSFVLGFDNLFPLFFKKNTYGIGIYCNVAVSLFRNRACRKKPLRVADCPPSMKIKKEKTERKRIFRPRKKQGK